MVNVTKGILVKCLTAINYLSLSLAQSVDLYGAQFDIWELNNKTMLLNQFLVVQTPIFIDPAMKEFLVHLDETMAIGKKYIIQDLDETHLFISSDVLDILNSRIDELMDKISFPMTEK